MKPTVIRSTMVALDNFHLLLILLMLMFLRLAQMELRNRTLIFINLQ
jgi:hypothetical protein